MRLPGRRDGFHPREGNRVLVGLRILRIMGMTECKPLEKTRTHTEAYYIHAGSLDNTCNAQFGSYLEGVVGGNNIVIVDNLRKEG